MVRKKTTGNDRATQKERRNQGSESEVKSGSESENRRHVRFPVSRGAFVALHAGQSVVGRVKDVSLGGLAFEYIKDAYLPLADTSKINLFMSEQNFYLSEIPGSVIYEAKVKKDPLFEPFSSIDMYKCGIRFKKLREDQLQDLVQFIDHCQDCKPDE